MTDVRPVLAKLWFSDGTSIYVKPSKVQRFSKKFSDPFNLNEEIVISGLLTQETEVDVCARKYEQIDIEPTCCCDCDQPLHPDRRYRCESCEALKTTSIVADCQHRYWITKNGRRHCEDCGSFIGYAPGREPGGQA